MGKIDPNDLRSGPLTLSEMLKNDENYIVHRGRGGHKKDPQASWTVACREPQGRTRSESQATTQKPPGRQRPQNTTFPFSKGFEYPAVNRQSISFPHYSL